MKKILTVLTLMLISTFTTAANLTLTWTTPQSRVDGTPIQNIDLYRIYPSVNNITQPVIEVSGDLNQYVIPDVDVGMYTFQISAVEAGLEGLRSDPVSKTISEIEASMPSKMTITVSLTCEDDINCNVEMK